MPTGGGTGGASGGRGGETHTERLQRGINEAMKGDKPIAPGSAEAKLGGVPWPKARTLDESMPNYGNTARFLANARRQGL